MRQGSNPRRGRSRGNAKRHPSSRNQNVESNGPDVKLRGTAQQVHEKYLSLARDASSAGDRIGAESYFQFADHYYRMASDQQANGQSNGNRITGKQYRFIIDLMNQAKMTKREINDHCMEAYGAVVDHISRSDASSLIDWLHNR